MSQFHPHLPTSSVSPSESFSCRRSNAVTRISSRRHQTKGSNKKKSSSISVLTSTGRNMVTAWICWSSVAATSTTTSRTASSMSSGFARALSVRSQNAIVVRRSTSRSASNVAPAAGRLFAHGSSSIVHPNTSTRSSSTLSSVWGKMQYDSMTIRSPFAGLGTKSFSSTGSTLFASVTDDVNTSTDESASASASSPSMPPSSSSLPYDLVNKQQGLGSYTPTDFESKMYQWWEESGCFLPDAKKVASKTFGGDDDSVGKGDGDYNQENKKKPYVLPMPPPNVTGRLHMGHAIFVALQDVLARFHRMRGRPVLWLPG